MWIICFPSFNSEKYFIIFIDNFSHYKYIYMLHKKLCVMNVLEVYICEVERQLDRKIKLIRSNRDGVYYWWYNKVGQCPR